MKIHQLMNKLRVLLGTIYLRIFRRLSVSIERFKLTENLFMIVVAVIIGVAAGFGAVGIRMLIEWINHLSWGAGEHSLLEGIKSTPWYWKIGIPALGGLIVGPLIYKFAPEAKGHGVPEVMQAIILRNGTIRPRVALVKAIASAITIGTGGSVGREGPIIQIGSSMGSTFGQIFRVAPNMMKTFVGCGAAAGIAAAFNAPVAGALFALEIILMDYAVRNFSPIVISSVMATVISHTFEGDFAAFQVPTYQIVSNYEVGFYMILGLISGLISWMFIKVLYFSEDLWDEKIKLPQYIKPFFGGIMVGAMAIYFPEVLGIGYETMDMALKSNAVWYIAIILIFLKIIATSITLGSGGSGGVFAPSLFMGAMAGAAFGALLNYLFPDLTAQPGAYALVAMGGLVAGTTRAPITAIIIVFELTKQTSIILPLMITCTISVLISTRFSRESIYTLKLILRNIKIKSRPEINILDQIHVEDIYSKEFNTIAESADFDEVVNTIVSRNLPYISVVKNDGEFVGIISIFSIKELLFDKEILKNVLIAGDLADRNILRAYTHETAREIMEKTRRCEFDGLPVMDPDNPQKQIGTIWRRDIGDIYQKEMEKAELASDLAEKITKSNYSKDVQFLENYAISEIKAPRQFIGRTIKNLKIRNKYGVDVLSVKRQYDSGHEVKAIPDPDYEITENDILIIAGELQKINILKNLV